MTRLMLFLILLSACAYGQQSQYISNYRNAVGVIADYGDYYNFIGFTYKHFVSRHAAVKADVGFGTGLASLKLFYMYQDVFSRRSAVNWYIGVGPGFTVGDVDPVLAIGPVAGLDIRLFRTPVRVFVDWRPQLSVSDESGAWEGMRLGLGVRYGW